MNVPSDDETPRDRFFDGFRRGSGAAFESILEAVAKDTEGLTAAGQSRNRKLGKAAVGLRRESLEAILADVLHAALGKAGPRKVMVYLSHQQLGKHCRYRSPVETRAFGPLLKLLAAREWLTMESGGNAQFRPEESIKTKCTTIEPGPRLLEKPETEEIGPADLWRALGGETIRLRAPKRGSLRGPLIDYEDTPHTQAMRAQMESLNRWLASLNIEYEGEGVDLRSRHMRRTFSNGRFDHGGRFFGGFWQPMEKAERGSLRIDGERIAVVDYSSTYLQLLYALEGATPPEGDLYHLPALPNVRRDGVKLLCSKLLFKEVEPQKRDLDLRAAMGTADKLPEIMAAIRKRHAPIARHLPSKIGYRLFWYESEILLDVLTECQARSLPALPIHDAIIVPASSVDEASSIMTGCFRGKMRSGGKLTITYPDTISTSISVTLQGGQLSPSISPT